MLNTKALAGFFGRFLAFFTAMLLLWPIVGETYGTMYRSEMNTIFSSFFADGVVSLKSLQDEGTTFDTDLILASRTSGLELGRRINSYQQGYLPTIYLLGLILATPIPWSRRFRAILWGLVIVNIYLPLRLLPALLLDFSNPQLGVVTLGPWFATIVRFFRDVVHIGFAGHFVVPIPIWFLLCFRRGDAARILGNSKEVRPPAETKSGSAAHRSLPDPR